MLKTLTIENFALIEQLEFQPVEGLTVITGETGAGKSIIMGALGLLLGQRADAKTVRTGATKCVVEGTFDIAAYGMESFFGENDLEYDAHATIVRREIYATGKSRAFVNDIPVQLSMLKALGEHLIDIHSQHQNLLIGKDTFQQEVLDSIAGNSYELGQYRAQYKELTQLRKQLVQAKAEAERNLQEADYIRYQFEQLEAANLTEGEQETLEEEQELLSHAEEIKGGLLNICEGLNGDGENVLSLMRRVQQEAHRLSALYPNIKEIAERLESDCIDLSDIASDVEGQAEEISFDPERFGYVEERLAELYQLQKKHGCTSVGELIGLRDELNEKILHLDNSDDEIAELEQQVKTATDAAGKCAAALTASRQKAARELEKKLVAQVATLGMPNVRFEVQIKALADFSTSGRDEITYLFSANKNQPLKPCGEVASGGEISRLMLSIKALVAAAKTLPTIIFDEIDTGVSGDIADRMGEVMKEMSGHLQVITITHLPQVAGKGDAHFKVYKEDTDDDTQTHISELQGEAHIEEVARMLSGSKITDEALANARVLCNR